MDIITLLSSLKTEYQRLLNGNLELYSVTPALDAQITQLNAQFNIQLPAEYCSFLTKADIKVVIEDGYDFIAVERIEYQLNKMNRWLDEGKLNGLIDNIDGDPSPLMKNVWWNKKWVPIAEDGGGNLLCIDLDSGEKGTSGQIIGFDLASGPYPTQYKSFGEFLTQQLAFAQSGQLKGSSDGTLS